jgi:hypothetical protein
LAYVPNNRSDTSKFRSIRIKLRPGLIARTRNGYYPTDVPMTKDMMSRDIYDASLNTLPYTGLPVTVTGKVTQDTVACTLYINAQAVSWQSLPNGDSHAQLRIASASFSADKLLDYEVKEKESTIPAANFKAVLQRPLAVHVEVPLSKGVKRLRFVIRDEATGHMGAVDVDPNNIPTAAEMPKLFSEQ